MLKRFRLGALALAMGLGCARRDGMQRPTAGTQEPAPQTLGRAELRPVGESQARGTVVVAERADGQLQLKGRVRGLEPNSSHALLLNPAGECAPAVAGEELAYLGTITADQNGVASLSMSKDPALLGSTGEIIGSSVILREQTTSGVLPRGDGTGSLAEEPADGGEAPAAPEPEQREREAPGEAIDGEAGTEGAEPGMTEPGVDAARGEGEGDAYERDRDPTATTMEACAVIVPDQRG